MNTKHLTKGIVVILLLFITSSIYAAEGLCEIAPVEIE